MTGEIERRVSTQNALAALNQLQDRGVALLVGKQADGHRYRARARSSGTQAAYSTQWRLFVAWCAGRLKEGLAKPSPLPLPADPELVEFYAEHLAELGRAASSVQKALSAITAVHALAGLPVPTADPRLRETMRGVRREVGAAPRQQADPLGPAELTKIIAVMTPGFKATRDISLLTLGVAGGYRRSELGALHVEDVRFVSDGIVVRLRRSKVDQEGRSHERKISVGKHIHTCPVRALHAWLAHSRIQSGPLFPGVTRHGKIYKTGHGLNGRSVDKLIRHYARAAGLKGHFSGHSLRSGCINALARGHSSPLQVQKHVDHSSAESTARYYRPIDIETSNVTKDMGL